MDTSSRPSLTRSTRPFLSRCRRPAVGWLQLFIVIFWTITPAIRTNAIYVPDASNNPYWVPFNSSDFATIGPDTGDADENYVADWYDTFQAAVNASTLTWWGGGSSFNGVPFMVNGVAVTYAAQWCPPLDSDGDGIPDAIDPYPSDPYNNTNYWWPGNNVTFNGNTYSVRAQWFAGSGACTDGSGIPDCVRALLTAPGWFQWAGGTFSIDSQTSTFAPTYLYGSSTDSDGDGIPDLIDPYPSDPWNNTYAYWAGGEWVINGLPTHFNACTYAGLPSPDSDGDGIPDSLDPYPGDFANNTAWWQGGTFLWNDTMQSFAGCWHAANAGDADLDGIPDDLDSYPYDQYNNSTWWSGGYYVINGCSVSLPGQWHLASEADSDGDGIPDSLDPYPNDNTNQSFRWNGGTFSLNDASISFPGGWYAGSWVDSDNDGIPDPADIYPYSGNNGNQTWFWWQGGSFTVDGVSVYWPTDKYPGVWADTDNDGIPDSLDPYPTDVNNHNPPTFWWPGGAFRIDWQWLTLPGQTCIGVSNSNFPDADHDGIPDSADPYPTDYFNNCLGFVWPPLDSNWAATTVTRPIGADNHLVSFTSAIYYATWWDIDGDGIPDLADPYPEDYYNHTDTDGDGIPDSVEVSHGLNPNDPADADQLRYIDGQTDRITWKQAYDRNWLDALQNNWTDTDFDGMSDLYGTVNGLDLHIAADAMDAPVSHLPPGTTATMNDFILNFERARRDTPISRVISDPQAYQLLTGHAPGEGISHNFGLSVAENDWDGDGVSNWDEVLIFHTDPRNALDHPTEADLLTAYLATETSLTTSLYCLTHFALTDTDGDRIPDVVEYHQPGLNRTYAGDAGNIRFIDGHTDWLTWLAAYELGIISTLDPNLDSDDDDIPDVVENQFHRNRLNHDDAAQLRSIVIDGIEYTDGLTWKQAYDLDQVNLYYLAHLSIESPSNVSARQSSLTQVGVTWQISAAAALNWNTGTFTIECFVNGNSALATTRTLSDCFSEEADGILVFQVASTGQAGSTYRYEITYDNYGGMHSEVATSNETTFLDATGLSTQHSDGDFASDLFEFLAGTLPYDESSKPTPVRMTGPDSGVKVKTGKTKTFTFSATGGVGTLVLTIENSPTLGSASMQDNGNGSFTVTYAAGAVDGAESVTITATDTYLPGTVGAPISISQLSIPITVEKRYDLQAEPKTYVLQPWEYGVTIPLETTGGDDSPITYSIVEFSGPSQGGLDETELESGSVAYIGDPSPDVSDSFEFKVEDESGSSTAQISIMRAELGVKFTAWTPGKIAGGTTGTELTGDTAILQPNTDNDDGVSTSSDHQDNADTDIQPDDDDIVMVEITPYKGDTQGTLVLNVPPNIRVFKSDGTLMTDYNLDPDEPTTRIYIEGLDDFDGATLSATYTPMDDTETSEEPGATPQAAPAGNSVSGSLRLKKVTFIAQDIYRGFDPPIKNDVDPSGKKDDMLTDWWTITHFIPSATQSVLDNVKDANPLYFSKLNHFLSNAPDAHAKIEYVIDENETPIRAGIALTQLGSATTDGNGRLKVNNKALSDFSTTAPAVVVKKTNFRDVAEMLIEVQETPPDGGVHDTTIEVRGTHKPAATELATSNRYGLLKVLVAPLRIVEVGLWYLEDGVPGTDDAPPLAYLDGERVLDRLNQTFWQSRVLFVPKVYGTGDKPAFQRLEMQYGTLRQDGIRELDLEDTVDCKAVHDALNPGQNPLKRLNIVVVGHVPARTAPAYHPFGITHDAFPSTCFIQSDTIDPKVAAAGANKFNGAIVFMDDYYTIFAHEVGHSLGLSTRNPSLTTSFRKHDQGDFPYLTYNLDGTPVAKWIQNGKNPINDISTTMVLWPWGAPIDGLSDYKRRSKFPLMYQSSLTAAGGLGAVLAVPMPGNGLRSLWIRHEEWKTANEAADTYH
jgi:hypothetical protein